MSADRTTNTLIVTGSAEDHQQIEPLVKELDVAPPTTRVLKPYTVKNADPQEVYRVADPIVPLQSGHQRWVPGRNRHDSGLRPGRRSG